MNPSSHIELNSTRIKRLTQGAAIGLSMAAGGALALAWRLGLGPVWIMSLSHVLALAGGAAMAAFGLRWAASRLKAGAQPAGKQPAAETKHVRTLLERINVASKVAGISNWEFDLDSGRFVWLENRSKAFGLDDAPLEEFSREFRKRIHPSDLRQIDELAKQAKRGDLDTFSTRYRVVRPDGHVRHLHSYAHVLRDERTGSKRLVGATIDVTNEVQTAELLQRQAKQQEVLLERLSIATQVADISSWELDLRASEFRWVDNPLKALLRENEERYSVAELMARTFAEDRHVFAEQIARAQRDGVDRVSFRYRAIATDGSTVHMQSYAKLFFDEQRRPISALGASWDVTKEVQAAEQLALQAEQLRIAERRLERASLSSSEGHWESDINQRNVWLSSSYHAVLGYRPGELPKDFQALKELLHPDDRPAHEAAIRRHFKEGAPYLIDCRMRCADGEYRWMRHRGTAECDAEGRLVRMSGSIQDVHEQKLAENALQLVQQRFERAINGTQDGLWELEADGTAWCSPRLAELLGYSPEELPSNTNFLKEYLHPEDIIAVAAAAQAHFQESVPYDVEIRLRTRSGQYRWFRARASAERDAQGKPLRLSGSIQDVTEARAAREALVKATEAAEAANRAKSFFLANVSHEIRTPMNGIIGMTGLLLDTALDRTQRDYAETIRSSADSLLSVINDILDLSKIEAGKLEIETIELDLRGNVEDVGSMMAFQAAAKNLELVVHVHPDVPDRVIGDPQRIRQCLINLVGNAIKFTRQGEIVIEVSIEGRRDGKTLVHFQVRDTGIGIPKEALDTLFQPFVQADASTTRHFGGTGLGLSIVQRLVEMMGGAVGIESEVGKGSTFWFTLPLEPVANAAPARPVELHRLGRRILIVDDHETNRRVLAGQLMHVGYEVSLAATGQEALQLLRQGRADNYPYDIVLADYRMEDMDGATLGERINSDPHLSSARIVILTSLDRHGDIRRFASLGFAAYLTKPVRARELLDCLDRVLAREAKEWHMQSQPIITRGTLISEDTVRRRYEGNVLLVEDNPVNQKVALRFLERLGCRVRVADNGLEGVKAFRDGHFDLILMDLQMPVMDGLTATQRIRELEQGHRMTPIVALTANAMAGQLERCMAAGMNGFLEPISKSIGLNKYVDSHACCV